MGFLPEIPFSGSALLENKRTRLSVHTSSTHRSVVEISLFFRGQACSKISSSYHFFMPFSSIRYRINAQVTRVLALGPADFVCGLSSGGVVRVRPGIARPHLLVQGPSYIAYSINLVKKVGVSLVFRLFRGVVVR